MIDSDRHAPRPGDVWQKNDSARQVRVEEVDNRWASVRNVETGRFSQIDLYTFNRQGKTGWTRVSEGTS